MENGLTCASKPYEPTHDRLSCLRQCPRQRHVVAGRAHHAQVRLASGACRRAQGVARGGWSSLAGFACIRLTAQVCDTGCGARFHRRHRPARRTQNERVGEGLSEAKRQLQRGKVQGAERRGGIGGCGQGDLRGSSGAVGRSCGLGQAVARASSGAAQGHRSSAAASLRPAS